jgi:hypothetical protein
MDCERSLMNVFHVVLHKRLRQIRLCRHPWAGSVQIPPQSLDDIQFDIDVTEETLGRTLMTHGRTHRGVDRLAK